MASIGRVVQPVGLDLDVAGAVGPMKLEQVEEAPPTARARRGA